MMRSKSDFCVNGLKPQADQQKDKKNIGITQQYTV